ncbi:MAG: hypothetical protein EB034_21790 [Verrucomicrobia bacterium]|nr:hypothetical protein [Verrucomicrobiota bacterium]
MYSNHLKSIHQPLILHVHGGQAGANAAVVVPRLVAGFDLHGDSAALYHPPRDKDICLRFIRVVVAEQHEERLEDNRYLNPTLLREQNRPTKTRMKLGSWP